MKSFHTSRKLYVLSAVIVLGACTKEPPPAPKPAVSSTSPDPVALEEVRTKSNKADPRTATPQAVEAEVYQKRVETAVKGFCGRCHAFPDPADFTMQTWGPSIKFMYRYFDEYRIDVKGAPPPFVTMRYYAERAAKTIQTPSFESAETSAKALTRQRYETDKDLNTVADLVGVNPKDGFGGDVLIANMLTGVIASYDTKRKKAGAKVIGKVNHPARLTVVDLDRDGRKDVLVGELGTFGADDHGRGKAIWLRQVRRGKFKTVALTEGMGRVAEIAAGTLDDDKHPDIVIAEFGWLNTGSLTVLHNPGKKTKGPARRTKLDAGRGATSVQVGDLNGDGIDDIVALYGQEREEVIAYIGDGKGAFSDTTIHRANTPLWGATRLRLVDLDKDGKLDVLVANGDTLDAPRIASFQGVHLLKNLGRMKFSHQQLIAFPGVQDFQVFDYDKDNDLDIVAVASLPPSIVKLAKRALPAGRVLASAMLLEQQPEAQFKAYTLSDDAPCFSSLGVSAGKKKSLLAGHFGLGWDVLGHTQTITTRQTVLNDCASNIPFEEWSIVAQGEAPAAPKPIGLMAQRLEDRARLYQREEAFGRLLETQPLKGDFHMGRGITLAQMGKKDKALEVMRKAVQLNPKKADLLINVATLLNEIDEHKEAILMADKALAQRPNFPEALNAKAIAIAKMGNVNEALRLTTMAANQKPDYLPFQFNLVHLYMFKGKQEQALDILDQVLIRHPGHQVARTMRDQIRQRGAPPAPQ